MRPGTVTLTNTNGTETVIVAHLIGVIEQFAASVHGAAWSRVWVAGCGAHSVRESADEILARKREALYGPMRLPAEDAAKAALLAACRAVKAALGHSPEECACEDRERCAATFDGLWKAAARLTDEALAATDGADAGA